MKSRKLLTLLRAVLTSALSLLLAFSGVSTQALAQALDDAQADPIVVAGENDPASNASGENTPDAPTGTPTNDSAIEQDTPTISTDQDDALLVAQSGPYDPTKVRAPQSHDGTTVERFSLVWNTTDTTDDGSPRNLYLEPEDDATLSMQASMQFAFSGEKNYPAGTIQITVPAQVITDRNGNFIGTMTFGVPEQPDTSQSFAYKLVTPEDGAPYYLISNTRTLQSGTEGVIQFSIRGITPHEVESDAKSNTLQAELTLTTARGYDIVVGADPLTAQVHTFEHIDRTYKNGGTVMDAADAPDDVQAKLASLPGGASNYVLVRWNTYANVEGNQAFEFSMTDTLGDITANDEPVSSEGSIILGTSGSMSSDPGPSYSKTVLEHGSYMESGEARYEKVWSAYPKSLFADETDYKIYNDVTWTVTPTDDPDSATSQSAQTYITYRNPAPIVFVPTPGHYRIEKETLEPHRYPTSTNTALTDLKGMGAGTNSVAPKDTTIGFTVTAYGEIMEKTLAEGASFADVADPATDPNLHQRYVTMEATDDAIYLNGDYTRELASADYYISRVRMRDPRVYAYGHKDGDITKEWGYYRAYDAAPLPSVALWGLTESVGGTAQTWTKLATMSYDENNERTVTPAAEGVSASGADITLDKALAITRVKMTAASKTYDALQLEYSPYVTLRADSSRVQELIQELFATTDSPTATMRNDVTLAAYNGDGVSGTFGSQSPDAPTVDPADASLVGDQGAGIFAIKSESNQSVGFPRTRTLDVPRYGKTMWHYASHAYLRGAIPRIGVTSTKSVAYDDTKDLNRSTMQATLHYTATVHEQSNVLSEDIYNRYVQDGAIDPETSGTWYDLLPPGVSPILSTIRLRENDSVADAYTIENYKNSGRTLLVIKAELVPQLKYNRTVEDATGGEGYWTQGMYDELTLSFDAVFNYADAETVEDAHHNTVAKLVNLIAFESGNEQLGNQEGMMGEYDDATGGTGDEKVYRNKETSVAVEDTPDLTDGLAAKLMSGLDDTLAPAAKKPTFVYARDDTTVGVDNSSMTSISKTVATDAEGIYRTGTSDDDAAHGWSDHTNQENVYEGHGYTYRIQVAHGTGETSNIVLYDALENYQLNSGNSDYRIRDYRWKGELVSVDTSQLEKAGVAPVVYYSTSVEGFDSRGSAVPTDAIDANMGSMDPAYIQNTNLSDTNLWTPAASYDGQLSAVKAIAIDCSKTASGEQFILPLGESLVAYIHMKAPTEVAEHGQSQLFDTIHPDGDEDEPNNNSHAFNNVYIMSDVKGASEQNTQTEFYHPDYVKVGILPYKVQVKKVWDDANNNDNMRPESVTVRLLANGQPAKYEDGNFVQPATLNEGNDWTFTFEDIPYEDTDNQPIRYTVTEDAITKTLGDGTSVRLYAPQYLRTDDAHLQIVNRRAPETVDVCGTKTWNDNGDAAGKRPATIQVRLYANGVHKDTERVGEATDGTWSYAFTDLPAYKDGEKIVYTVVEEPIDYYATDYAASTEGSGSVVEDGVIQGSTDITNTYSKTGLLAIAKKTEGVKSQSARDASFAFTVELFDAKPDAQGNAVPLADEYTYYVIDDATGERVPGVGGTVTTGGTVSVKGGQRAVIEGIPVGSTYRVTEQPAPGFRQSESSGTTGTITAGVDARHAVVASFTNTYHATGSFQLQATKRLKDQQLGLYAFRFQAYQVFNAGTSDEYEQVVRSTSNSAGGPVDASGWSTGEVTFERVKVTDADLGPDGTLELLYRIREVKVDAQASIYDYAINVEQVRVRLEDAGNGTITATQEPMPARGTSHILSLDGTTPTESDFTSNGDATFENTYKASGSVKLSAYKVLKGRALGVGEFTFKLEALTSGAPVADTMTAANDADGVVTFAELPLTGAHGGKSFIYKVTEEPGTDSGVVYSSAAIYYRVDVTDNGKGVMASTQTVVAPKTGASAADVAAGDPDAFESTEASPTIINTLEPGNLQITKQLTGDTTGHEGQAFTFRVRLTGEGLADFYTYTVGSTSTEAEVQDGVFEVTLAAGQTALIKGIPAGTSYQVFENTVAGWELVSQSGTSGTIAADTTSTASFTNQYAPGTATAQLFATKTLDGASSSREFEFVLAANAGAPMPEGAKDGVLTVRNDATGLVSFDSIAYERAGTYTYSIIEKKGTDDDFVYDETEWTATVVVSNKGTDANPIFSTAVTYSNGVDEPTATPPVFANTTMPGELTVKKVGENITPKNENAEFDFTVQLQNDGQPVDKASFYVTDAEGNIVNQSQGDDSQPGGGATPGVGMSTWLSGARDSLVHLFVPRVAYAEEPTGPNSGTFGVDDSCTWEWDQATYTITVRATTAGVDGDVGEDIQSGEIPWEVHSSTLKHFVVDDSRGKVAMTTHAARFQDVFKNSSIITADLSGLDLSGYARSGGSAVWSSAFEGCTSLTSVTLPHLSGGSAGINASKMFKGCTNLTSVTYTGQENGVAFELARADEMFSGCTNLESIDLSPMAIVGMSVTVESMFNGCEKLVDVNMGLHGAEGISNMSMMFQNCSGLVDIDLSKLVYSTGIEPALTNLYYMFYGCRSLQSLNYFGLNTSHVTNMRYMFAYCTSLTTLDLSELNTSSVTSGDTAGFNGMFRYCSSLKSLDMSGLSTAKNPGTTFMFSNPSDNDLGGVALEKLVIGNNWTHAYDRVGLPPANWVKVEDAAMGSAIVLTSDELMGRSNDTYNQAHRDDYKGTWVRAVDTASKYVVTYNPMGAYYMDGEPPTALPGSVTQTVGQKITLPKPRWNDDSKTFVAWRTGYNAETGEYSGESFEAGAEVDNTDLGLAEGEGGYRTLFAQWASNTVATGTVNVYQQNADRSGYTLVSSNPYPFTAATGSSETINPPQDYDGFVTPDPQTVTVVNGLAVDFMYDRVAYTVAFDANYDDGATGTSGSMAPMTMVGGVAKKLTPNAFAWKDHTFVGWNTVAMPTAENPGTSYADQAQVKNLAANGQTITLYAQWVAGRSASSSTGTYHFTLKPGQTVHFANVPAGTRYSVVESPELPNGWTQTAASDVTGTVPANDAANAVVTNTYDATGVVSLEATKKMLTGSLTAGQFDFELLDSEDNVLQTMKNLDPEEDTDAAQALAQVLFDPLEYKIGDLIQDGTYAERTFTYTIREVVPEGATERIIGDATAYAADGVIYGANGVREQTVTVTVADNGAGSLKVTPSTSTNAVEFVNDYDPGALQVTKTTIGTNEASSGATFTFQVKLTDAQGKAVHRAFDLVRISADGSEEPAQLNGAVFNEGVAQIEGVGAGGGFRIVGIPKDAAYEVTEISVPAGFTQSAATGTTGTIGAGTTSEASFTNAYEAEGAVTLKATKTLEDGNIADYTFTFQLYDEGNKLLQTKTTDASGVVTFDALGFSAADAGTANARKVYNYKIVEVNDRQDNVVYDTHSGWLSVYVWDDGAGKVTAQAVYDHDATGVATTTPETFANKLLHPVEMPATGGSGLAVPLAVATIALTAEAARRMRRQQREETSS